MYDMKELMKEHYIKYASYVILDRAIPELIDGLKPVQRRILHALYRMHDGKFHKVANITGQTMAFHPHGDAPIYEALVGIANKGFLLDCQGNFGNPLTGDPAAASRYIEARLSSLALQTCFNPKLTEFVPSYDGRQTEPIVLPIKIPLLLMQGADGIAVGMSTKILPHNFTELLQAEIAYLENRPFSIVPDFPTAGIADVSQYADGKGKVRVRATIETKDPKTIVIRELAFGTTTESVIASIEEAAKRGKIKIDAINDYTAEKVEIEIRLPRGVYASEVIDSLYAFTDCEVSISSMMVIIQDGNPKEVTVTEAISFHAEKLKGYLAKELELELQDTKRKIFERMLEEIFIQEKIYKRIEEVEVYEEVFSVLEAAFKPFHEELKAIPQKNDFEMLLSIPIRRIAKFDQQKNRKEIDELSKRAKNIEKSLKQIVQYTISFLKDLIDRYGSLFPRRTKIQDLGSVDKRQIETKVIEVGYDLNTGYIGTKVSTGQKITCTNFDRLILYYNDGTYKVVPIEEKEYVGKEKAKLLTVEVADKNKIMTCIYTEKATGLSYCKRFVIKQFILNKEYQFLEEGQAVKIFTDSPTHLIVHLVPKLKQKVSAIEFDPLSVAVKGVTAKGIRISPRPILSFEKKDPATPLREALK